MEKGEGWIYCRMVDDSMQPRILAGDTAFILPGEPVPEGGVGLFCLDGSRQIRQVFYTQSGLLLCPFNAKFPSQLVRGGAMERLKVVGRVIRTVRRW